MKAAGHLVDGIAAYRAGRFNRAVARTNATNALRDGAMEETRIREAARAAMGRQVALQSAGGFMPGQGSALDELRESALNASLDILLTRRRAGMEAQGFDVQGRAARAAGNNALLSGALRAAGEIADYAKGG